MLKRFANPAWAMLEYGWYPLLLFVATPWFLHRLGVEAYGLWMLLVAIVGFGAILTNGTGTATIKAVSSAGDEPGPHAVAAVRNALGLALLGGALLALAIASTFVFAGDALWPKMGAAPLVRLTGIAAAVLIWIEQADNVFASAIKGLSRFGHAARIEIAAKTTQLAAAAAVLIPFPRLEALYAALAAVALCRLAAKAVVAKRLLGAETLMPVFSGRGDLLHFAKWGWLLGVGGVLFGVADRLLIGGLLGAGALAYYAIASQLAMQVHAVAAAGLSVVFPAISREAADIRTPQVRRKIIAACLGNLALSGSLAIGIWFVSPWLLDAWVGPQVGSSAAVVLPWLILAYWLLALNVVPYYVLLGVGRIRFVGLTVLLAGIVAAACAYLALARYGAIAAPAGRIAYAVMSLALVIPFAGYLRGTGRVVRLRSGDAHMNEAAP